MACRSLEKAHRAVEEIKNATGVDDDRVPIMQLDLSSLKSVYKFASEFKQSELIFSFILLLANFKTSYINVY